jgi:hypothetical protein
MHLYDLLACTVFLTTYKNKQYNLTLLNNIEGMFEIFLLRSSLSLCSAFIILCVFSIEMQISNFEGHVCLSPLLFLKYGVIQMQIILRN